MDGDKTKEKKKVKKTKESKESKSKPTTPKTTPKVKKIPTTGIKKITKDVTTKSAPTTPKKAKSVPSTPKSTKKEVITPKKIKKEVTTPSKPLTPKVLKKAPLSSTIKTIKKEKPKPDIPVSRVKLDGVKVNHIGSESEGVQEPPEPATNHLETPVIVVETPILLETPIIDEPSIDNLNKDDLTDVPIQLSDLSTGVIDLTENIRIRLAKLLDECQDNMALLMDLHKDMCDYLKMKGIILDAAATTTTTTTTTATTTSNNNNHIMEDTKENDGEHTEKGDSIQQQNNPLAGSTYALGSVSVSSSTDATELLRGMSAQEKAALRAKALQRIRKIKERMVTPDGERAGTPDPVDSK